MAQGTLGAAGYGVDVGRSVRTVSGAGHIVSPRAQIVLLVNFPFLPVLRTMVP